MKSIVIVEWKKLGDVVDVKDGTHDSPKYVSEKLGYPLVTSKNIKDGQLVLDKCNYISEVDYLKINKRSKVDIGDIIMPMIGTIGNPCLIEEEVHYAIKNVALFKTKENDSKFLLYWLNSDFIKNKFKNDSKGGTQKFVSLKYLRNLPFPFIPLTQQKKIAQTLDKAKELIELRKESIKKLDALAKSVFVDMFGDVHLNTMNWKKEEVSNYINLLTGYPFKSKDYSKNDEDIKLCGGLIITPHGIDWNKANYWNRNDTSHLEKYWLEVDDIVMAMDRPWISSGFKIYQIKKNDTNTLLVQRTARIRAINMNPKFLYFLFKEPSFVLQSKVTETTVPHISPKDIKNYKVIVPPLPLQQKFANIIQKIENQKALYEKELEKLEENFEALLAKSFG